MNGNGIRDYLKKLGYPLSEEGGTKLATKKKPSFDWLKTPKFYTPEEAKLDFGIDLEEGWMLKIMPDDSDMGFAERLISPKGEELSFEDVYIKPSGEWVTMAEMEGLYAGIEGFESDIDELVTGFSSLVGSMDVLEQKIASNISVPERMKLYKEWTEYNTELDDYIKGLRDLGQTPETEAFLKLIGVPDQEISVFFEPMEQGVISDYAITEQGEHIPEGFIKDTWDAMYLGLRRLLHRSGQYFVSTLPSEMFPPLEYGEILVTGTSKPIKITPEVARQMGMSYEKAMELSGQTAEQREQLRTKFRSIYIRRQDDFEAWLVDKPELQPKPEYEEGVTEHPELLKDPGYWGWAIADSFAYTMAVMGTTLGVGFLTKNPYLALAAGTAVATPAASQDLYEDLIASGAPESEAASLAVPIGFLIASIESATDLPFLAAVSPAFNILKAGLRKTIIKQGVRALLKQGIKTGGKILFTETILEEVPQSVIQNAVVKIYDENRGLFEDVDETIIRTLIATLPFAIFGGGMTMRHVSQDRARAVAQQEKIDQGWEFDELTGIWYEPVKMETFFKELLADYKEAGMDTEEATWKALSDLARTPEGEKAISDAALKIKMGEKLAEAVEPEVIEPQAEFRSNWKKAQEEASERIEAIEEEWVAKEHVGPTQEQQTRIDAVLVEVAEKYNVPQSTLRSVTLWEAKGEVKVNRTPLTDAEIDELIAGVVYKPGMPAPVTLEVVIPKAEPGMPEAGLQPSMIEGIAAKEVIPKPTAKVVQAKLEDYLKLKEYSEKQTTDRISEIKDLLDTKGRLPKGEGTKTELSLELVRLEAQKELDQINDIDQLDHSIEQIKTEMGNRSMPYHGGAVNLYPEYTGKQLDERLKVFEEARETLQPKAKALPKPKEEVVKASEIAPSIAGTSLSISQVDATLKLFGQAVMSPDTIIQRDSTIELRKYQLAQRAKDYAARVEELIIEGKGAEEAMNLARQETMSGKLPELTTEFFSDLTQEMRDVLFAKVHHYWKVVEPDTFEEISTITALTNALIGKSISRKVGTGTRAFPQGGSAWDRLARTFADHPQILKALGQETSLENIIEGIFIEPGRISIPLDQKTVDHLKSIAVLTEEDRLYLEKPISQLSEKEIRRIAEQEYYRRKQELRSALDEGRIDQVEYNIESRIAKDKIYPYPEVTRFEPPIDDAFNQIPMLTFKEKKGIVRILKTLGMGAIDIGNLLRANKASFDFSFWRQAKLLAAGHPVAMYRANVEAWKALWSQKDAEANWLRITSDPDFELYEHIRKDSGADPLRIFEAPKGTAQYRAAEELGYLTGERAIPRFTAKIPWIKWTGRSFVVGCNTVVWEVWKGKLKIARREAQKIASGETKLSEGEAFDIYEEMKDQQVMLTDLIQRASLGKAAGLAPALSATFFAPRSKLARLIAPRHLISSNPRVRAEAWKDFMLFFGTQSAVLALGVFLGLWSCETDPKSGEFGSIRIGNLRIDPWSGYRQYFVLYNRLITGTGISSVSGKEYEADPIRALTSFFRTSLAPLPAIFVDFSTGKNFLGEDVGIADTRQWIERVSPFAVWDIWEAYEDDWHHGAIAVIPAILGEGVQTYTGDWVENWTKLGIPKYLENTAYGLYDPKYTTEDFWSDTAGQFVGVDPSTLTEQKGYPEYIRAIVEARQIIEQLDLMPNVKLTSINIDPAQGYTLNDYYQMWQDREKLVAAGDEKALEEFDSDDITKYAFLGNMTQSQFALLIEYHLLPEKEQKQFIKDNPEIGLDPVEEWIKSHPEDNAKLAVWGKAKLLSKEAYDYMQKMIADLDIPDSGLPEMTLPPKGSVDGYFAYVEAGKEYGYNSAEAKIPLAKDDVLRQWLELQPVTTPIESLELQVKWRDESDLRDDWGDRDSPLYIEDDTERQAKYDEQYAGNPEFRDDMRRVEGYGFRFPGDQIENYVEYYNLSEKGYEQERYLLEHPEFYQSMIDLKDKVPFDKGYKVPDAKYDEIYHEWEELFEQYDNVTGTESERDITREAILRDNPEFRKARRRREAYGRYIPADQVEDYVGYYEIPPKSSDDWYVNHPNESYYEDDWYLMEHPEFYKVMIDPAILGDDAWNPDNRNFPDVPTRDVYKKYRRYVEMETPKSRLWFRCQNEDLDDWLHDAKGLKRAYGTDRCNFNQ